MILLALIAFTLGSASAQVHYSYNEAYCFKIYDNFIPSGYFYGSNNERIHYTGQGYFLIGHPDGYGGYYWEEVYMDPRPLHRMVLNIGTTIDAVHIYYHNGNWTWMVSYSNVHYYGNHLDWWRCSSIPIVYSYASWDMHYHSLTWKRGHRPHHYDRYCDRNHRGDWRISQYSGSTNYGHRSTVASNGSIVREPVMNYNNPESNRRTTPEARTSSRNYLSERIAADRQGYTSREVVRNERGSERTTSTSSSGYSRTTTSTREQNSSRDRSVWVDENGRSVSREDIKLVPDYGTGSSRSSLTTEEKINNAARIDRNSGRSSVDEGSRSSMSTDVNSATRRENARAEMETTTVNRTNVARTEGARTSRGSSTSSTTTGGSSIKYDPNYKGSTNSSAGRSSSSGRVESVGKSNSSSGRTTAPTTSNSSSVNRSQTTNSSSGTTVRGNTRETPAAATTSTEKTSRGSSRTRR